MSYLLIIPKSVHRKAYTIRCSWAWNGRNL
nr:MAG TPA: hypothetical protein [Caudoviricetes sp.]